jgi:quercetin dioxygenase-like cupin family protein
MLDPKTIDQFRRHAEPQDNWRQQRGKSSRKWKIAIGLGITLTGAALAFQQTVPGITFLQTVTGTIDEFAFPPPISASPGVLQIQRIILKQGATTGWHHHDGPAWVILEKGRNVVESHCGGSEQVRAGAAFIEPPGYVHKVDNYGPGEATISWATVYPQHGAPIVEEADQTQPCPQ